MLTCPRFTNTTGCRCFATAAGASAERASTCGVHRRCMPRHAAKAPLLGQRLTCYCKRIAALQA
eukprot:15430915-Alexandrium_andersonii.AAC.1